MRTRNTLIAILLSLLLIASPVIAQEATQAVEPTPTMEAVATETPAPVSEPATDIQFTVAALVEFFTNNLPIIFMGIALVMSIKQVGKPQTQAEYDAEKKAIDRDREEVKKTKSMLDDLMVEGRYIVNEMRGIAQTPPTLPAPQPPVIDISQPPVGNTGSGTMDVSTPPFVPIPEMPHPITRNFGAFDPNLTHDHRFVDENSKETMRRVYTPVNTSPLFSNQNAAGKVYPFPSVNVNSAYGVQFDISWIAGAWGFTILETLVNNAPYKVRLEYTAQITGDKVDNLSDWLYHELDVNGKVTGVNQGISNGVQYAEWGITGTGFPVMITPRIRAMWASAAAESKVSWQRLTITPVDTLAG